MLSTKISTAIAVAVSTGVLLTCTFVVTYLINDINSLYDDIITDLEEIRETNRDAWHNMMNMQQKAGNGNGDIRNLFEFRRIKRASSNCSKKIWGILITKL
uniref:Nematode cuticle collagen N-terminal domain-containing protein n=1 Tax=Panagrolaimus davidi TaxID=227884 RepID=A0A914QPQ3_9BILA